LTAGFLACSLSFSYGSEDTLKGLSSNPVWLKLLHFRDGKSEIDDRDFFLSPEGYKNPLAELKATLKALQTSKDTGDNHPACRYPARYTFLKKHLDLKLAVKPDCKAFREFFSQIKPNSVSLVFSDYYINSPASMYGHTFLRIDPPFKSSLLGYAVNYAADVDRQEGLMYYIKGLTGGYKGFYSVFPYYRKIFEYSHLESRNLWEYRLKLDREDAGFIVMHLWELKERYSYYYFFDKNCSYQILYLIDVVKPELDLTGRFSLWTIPVETVRALKKEGMVEKVEFRPSATTLIKAFIKSEKLSQKEVETAKEIAQFKRKAETVLQSGIPERDKAKILEFSKLLFMYYAVKNKMGQEEYKKKLLTLLRARSKVKHRIKPYVPRPAPPEEGHKPQRLSLFWGTDDGERFVGFSYRTAYHSLQDDDTGYMEGSEVVFPSVKVVNYPDLNRTVLDRLTFVRILSLAERNLLFKPVSWGVNFSVERKWEYGKKSLFTDLSFGVGHSYRIGKAVVFYGLFSGTDLSLTSLDKSRFNLLPSTVAVFGSGLHKLVLKGGFGGMFTKNKAYYHGRLNGSYTLKLGRNGTAVFEGGFTRVFNKNRYAVQFSVNRYF